MGIGDRFVAQVQPVLHPQSPEVILLNHEGGTGRVPFTLDVLPTDLVFLNIHQHTSMAHAANAVSVSEQSIRITLAARGRALGSVLIRSEFPGGYNFQ